MRISFLILAIVSATACGQASPAAPALVVPAAVSGGVIVSPRTPSPPPIEPLQAQIDLVSNHLGNANHQLDLYLQPMPPPIVPPNAVHLRNALDFYLKANDVLDAIRLPQPPPIAPQWTEALNGIIGQANTTLSRLHADCDACVPSPPPIFQDLVTQAIQTRSLATALMPPPPPI